MVKQTPISFKVDSLQLARFDLLCKDCGVKRNHMLNFLVQFANESFADVRKYASIMALSDGLKAINE